MIIDGRFVNNEWVEVEQIDFKNTRPVLARFHESIKADWLDSTSSGPIGLIIENTSNAAVFQSLFDSIQLIVIEFPAIMDGRGYSLAENIRRLGYQRELRARGEIISDQYHHLIACGFDSVEITDQIADRHTELEWRKAWKRFPLRYQTRHTGLPSILAQRHATINLSNAN